MAEEPNGDSYRTEHVPYMTMPANPPTLSEIAEVLQNGMQPLFQQLNVDIASCPYLATAPYNLAGVGLCGNPTIIDFVHRSEIIPWNHRKVDIREILASSCRDLFVIGSSYATKPHMPHYGHLIMNATYRAPMDLKNESRLIFAERRNGQTTIEKLTDPNQMIATQGIMFVSEGKAGLVIRVRAKGRKTINTDIITSMQTILYERYKRNENKIVALGGVLKMKYGSVACNLMWDDYQEPVLPFYEFTRRQHCAEIHLESDMVAVGGIINNRPEIRTQEQRYDVNLLYNRSEFHCFSNNEAGGQFISDTTPDTTEYEGYFNVAENIQYPYKLHS